MAANFFSPRTLAVFIVPLFLPFGGLLDIGLFFFFMVIQNWDGLLAFVSLYINPAVVIDFAKAGAALFTILQILRYFMGLKALSSPSDGFLAKPMIFPCRTSHTRLFPKIHSFSYSYLWVGIPVGWRGSVGGMLSSDASKQSYPWYMRLLSPNAGGAWNTVDGDDYLGRGHVDGGLQEKLQNYLQSQARRSVQHLKFWLLTYTGYRIKRIPIRLSPDGSALPELRIQSSLNMESLFCPKGTQGVHPRSQQHFR